VFAISTVNAEIMVETIASTLNVRSYPSISKGAVIYSLPKGSVASVIERDGPWVQIIFLSYDTPRVIKEGWISSKYTQLLEQKDS
ncbi:MAG: SH3 domain-containing protein, partial [Gammaproteobacteria bacterium]|nr:SH3 domain-containing protein [Gammaproteobacteria bacterium]